MKSQTLTGLLEASIVAILRGDAKAFLLGCCDDLTSLNVCLEKDVLRVIHNIEHRGMGFITHDLPNLGAALLAALESKSIAPIDAFKRRKGSKLPAFMHEIWRLVFCNTTGELLETPNEDAILLIRAVSDIGKKLEVKIHPKYERRAYAQYIATDAGLPAPSKYWTTDDSHIPVWNNGSLVCFSDDMAHPLSCVPRNADGVRRPALTGSRWLLANLQRFCDGFNIRQPEYYPSTHVAKRRSEGFSGVRHGPGATATGNAQSDKYDFQNWSSRLDAVFPKEDFLPIALFGESEENLSDECVPSRVCAVPKDAKKVRLIACEPLENQWTQQLTADFISQNILPNCHGQIKLNDQSLSRKAAAKGSITGHLATIDLSDASDRLSCYVVERAFRKNVTLLTALRAHRTPRTIVPGHGVINLKKFASQGSAVTFPIQSIVFWLICQSIACNGDYTKLGKTPRSRSIRVYGDDLVCHTDDYENICCLIDYLQLKVNRLKSYSHGRFRESCGGDYYNGVDVTPIKLKKIIDLRKPSTRTALIDVINNAFKAGFWHLSNALIDQLPSSVVKRLPVGAIKLRKDGARAEGPPSFESFTGGYTDHLHKRWNEDLQVEEVRSWSLHTKALRLDRSWRGRVKKGVYEIPYLSEGYTSDILARGKDREVLTWKDVRLFS